MPFQVYGSWLEQRVMFVVLVVVLLIVRFNVATLSHPVEPVVV